MRLHGRTGMVAGSITSVLVVGLVLMASLLIAPLAKAQAAGDAKPAAGPAAESVLAAEEEYIRAMRENDADGIARCLTDDWAVISAKGGVAEGKSIFADGIRSGYLTRKTFEISEPRVRLYGDCRTGDDEGSNLGHVPG